MFYDRAGNQYEKVKQDLAGKLKQAIEKDRNGKRTGWTVTLESRNQGTIYTWDEYDFMMELFSGKNPNLPNVLIDMYHAKPLKCSLEITPTKIVEFKGKKNQTKTATNRGLFWFCKSHHPMKQNKFQFLLFVWLHTPKSIVYNHHMAV